MQQEIWKVEVSRVMQIIFYSSEESESERLSRFIEVIVPREKITYIHSLEALLLRLRHPLNNHTTIIFYISTREELLNVVAMQDLLCDFRLVVILPDKDKMSTSMAHTLRPRFIGYADDDYLDIVTVLGRMVEKSHYRESTGRAAQDL
jgi:hypothetical protein